MFVVEDESGPNQPSCPDWARAAGERPRGGGSLLAGECQGEAEDDQRSCTDDLGVLDDVVGDRMHANEQDEDDDQGGQCGRKPTPAHVMAKAFARPDHNPEPIPAPASCPVMLPGPTAARRRRLLASRASYSSQVPPSRVRAPALAAAKVGVTRYGVRLSRGSWTGRFL